MRRSQDGGAETGALRRPGLVTVLAGPGRAGVRGLAALPDGGGVAVGGFDGQLIGSGLSLSSAASDGFALRLSPAGAVQWSLELAGAGDAEITSVAARDGVAIAGTATGAAQLGGRAVQAAGQPGAVVARVDAGGAVQWVQAIGSTSYAVPTSLAWTPEGDVVVAGYFAGTLDPAGAALPGAGSLDVWVARLAGADGKTMWIHRAGGPGPDSAHAVAAGGDGVVVAGAFQRWADFSATTLRSEDSTADPFVAAVGADGFAAAWSFDAAGPAIAHGVVHAGGKLGLAITFSGSLEAGRRIEARPPGSGLVALVQSSGEVAWARPTPGSSAEAIAADGDRFLVAGASSVGGYVAGVTTAGQPVWSASVRGGAPATIAASGARVLVGGSATGRLTVGRFSAAVAGESDGFVARLPAR